jgi:hypothetical protein
MKKSIIINVSFIWLSINFSNEKTKNIINNQRFKFLIKKYSQKLTLDLA